MAWICKWAARVFALLGLALLVGSLLLVPEGRALGDEGIGGNEDQQKNCNTVFCEGGCTAVAKPFTCGDRKNDEVWCQKKMQQCNACVCKVTPDYPDTCVCAK